MDYRQSCIRWKNKAERKNEVRKFFGEVYKIQSGFINNCPIIKCSDEEMVLLDEDVQDRWK